MKISIITAAYNTEQYLPECINSVLRQTHSDWEMWCIDDCSSDSTWSILETFAAEDERIHAIHREQNGGLAKARNMGVKACSGDVIMFLDSDDWLSDDALQAVCHSFEAHPLTDCVLLDCHYVYPDHTITDRHEPFDVLSGKEAFRLSLTWKIHGVYAVRAHIHKALLYDESARWFSDENTTRRHYYASREVRSCTGTYFYRMNPTSVTHAVSIKHYDILDAFDSMRTQIKELAVPEDIQDEYEEVRWRGLIDSYLYYFLHRRAFSPAERKSIRTRIQKAWSETETARLPKPLRRHFGYIPFAHHWLLFRLQEEAYFTLRSLMGRNEKH